MNELNELEIKLFQEMYELTNPKCGQCRIPYSCCSSEYCEAAKVYTSEKYGIDLSDRTTGHKVPFMGPNGCVLEPHFRPLCTVHTCGICSMGYETKDDRTLDEEWTDRYFTLRNQINELL